jgi:hypothetical protein
MPAQPTGLIVAGFRPGGIRKGIRAFKSRLGDLLLSIFFAFTNAIFTLAFAMTANISLWYM